MIHLLAAASPPTQDQVFRSIEQSVSSSVDGTRLLAVLLALIAVIILVAVLGRQRTKKTTQPATLNHAGKLLKHVCKELKLSPGQLRQLKLLADQLRQRKTPVQNPLTILLCPSLVKKEDSPTTSSN